MTDDEDTEQINVEVPARTKELAKDQLEHGGLTRVIREKLTQIAHGEEASEIERVKDQLHELRDERRDLKRERHDIDQQLEKVDVKIERAENKLDELRDKEGEYEGALQMIEEEMHNEGMCVFEGHGRIKNAADIGDCTQQDVINDLKERNPDLPQEQFSQNLGGV
jgi:chromosome segregation ATPase